MGNKHKHLRTGKIYFTMKEVSEILNVSVPTAHAIYRRSKAYHYKGSGVKRLHRDFIELVVKIKKMTKMK